MKDIDKIITERHSVRTFDKEHPLTQQEVAMLRSALEEASSPFGGKVSIELKEFAEGGTFKPSTYGVIKGATWYFLMGTDGSEEAQLSLGFRMEQVVLKATAMGLGTCWIAATFKGTAFAAAANLPADTPLQIVMPVGHPADKKSLMEKATRTMLGSAKRRAMSDLFEVSKESKYYQPLEMMRLAPSASNSQPWRAIAEADTVYFYYEEKTKASILDLGIALSHFYLSARAAGIQGHLTLTHDAPAHPGWHPMAKFTTA